MPEESFIQRQEAVELFREELAKIDNSGVMFNSIGSAGNNPEKLARILAAFDMFINIMGWRNKPLAKFPFLVTQYQASLNGKYHTDYKDVLIAEEQQRKRAENKGTTINQSVLGG